jgi:hypothetical protein
MSLPDSEDATLCIAIDLHERARGWRKSTKPLADHAADLSNARSFNAQSFNAQGSNKIGARQVSFVSTR